MGNNQRVIFKYINVVKAPKDRKKKRTKMKLVPMALGSVVGNI